MSMFKSFAKMTLCGFLVAMLAIAAALLPANRSSNEVNYLRIQYLPISEKIELEETKELEDFNFPAPQLTLTEEIEALDLPTPQLTPTEEIEYINSGNPIVRKRSEITSLEEEKATIGKENSHASATNVEPIVHSIFEEIGMTVISQETQGDLIFTIYDDTATRLEALNNVFGKIGVKLDPTDLKELRTANIADQTKLLSEFFARSPLSVSVNPASLVRLQTADATEKISLLQKIFASFGAKIDIDETTRFIENYPSFN
ncbi:hypothetical protein K9N08_00735 [Candidatus Gracilibacteria bacterium]|nr:hypothetical protein [Candidatus Gracilibacteria bacterium]MCF7856069.1 hypothetical protein [Candidatus Gracilibacteria bacterium]MCF7896376.1 hypothetical protein [Candidatus Gracilibacteria bacterium]